jgi:DNA-binding HxlR family transcriptional regulator
MSRPKSTETVPLPLIEDALCPMPDIAKLIGGKWKLIILQILVFKGTQRFNQLRRRIEGITQTMLTNQLRALEEDGLVNRKIYAEVPPRVEYTATARAMALSQMFLEMHNWWQQDEARLATLLNDDTPKKKAG